MKPTLMSLLFLLVSCVCGALSGYYASSFSPIPAQIGVVDVNALVMKAVSINTTQTEEDAKALTAKVKAATDKLVQQGVVVLDAQSVINAPEEAYVVIE